MTSTFVPSYSKESQIRKTIYIIKVKIGYEQEIKESQHSAPPPPLKCRSMTMLLNKPRLERCQQMLSKTS